MSAPDSRKTTPGISRSPLVEASPPGDLALSLCPLGLLLSAHRHVRWCNAEFAALFGYTVEELTGCSLEPLYPSPVDFERIGGRGLHGLTERGTYDDERLMRLRDGSLRWFRVHGRSLDPTDPFRLASWVFEALPTGADVAKLTPRERDVLADMKRGLSAKQSASELGLSPRTVEKLRAHLRQRYGVHNATSLMSRITGLPD
ncbi:MAG: LuxR C-terminal-related transcriptional regulator [Burkholderiaceae bacterium]|nr:LuxR C-terminal-related transcriptional regulator [Burkholderiaceae bacterium]